MCGQIAPRWPAAVALLAAATFAAFTWLLLFLRCQSVAEVQPTGPLYLHRLPFHFLLLFLLLTAILTDLLDYSIPDAITRPGTLLAILLAFSSGDLQMIHIWVNWDYELVTIYGPWLPQWMKDHQHLHGLAWSLAGMVAGASVTEIIRSLAHKILGFHALGSGDVTLMAMIGAFIGWQPVLCTLAIAPLAGIAIGLPAFILSRRSFIAFGPCLCLAAIIVICSWRQLWEGQKLRIIFSHWPTVASILAGSLAAYTLLLLALRWFRTTPPESLRH
jgi:leader peptidase (prepilin peptidase)/N-methyltransferase